MDLCVQALLPRRRAPPGVTSEGAALGLAWGSSRAGAFSPPPGRGVAGAGTPARESCPAPRPGPAEPQRLPASPGLSGAALQAAPPQAGAQPGAPASGPSPHPRSEMAAGEGRPRLSARFPFLSGFL